MPIDGNEIRGKVLAHLISMTVQLKYLLIERFEWLLHVIQYVRHSFFYKLDIYSWIYNICIIHNWFEYTQINELDDQIFIVIMSTHFRSIKEKWFPLVFAFTYIFQSNIMGYTKQ